jgi:hypothetical protein
MPLELLVAVAGESVALAPVAGALKLTATPATGFPLLSDIKALSGVAKAAPMGVD